MKHERALKEKLQLLAPCTPSFYILHVRSMEEAARMAWNHEIAGSRRGVGRFFCFYLSMQGEGRG